MLAQLNNLNEFKQSLPQRIGCMGALSIMTDLAFNGQMLPSTIPGFDLDELITRIEAKLQLKQEILPNAIYDRDEAIALTGFSLSTFIRAEQKKRLKGRWEGRRRYYLGIDLLTWLKGKEEDNDTN